MTATTLEHISTPDLRSEGASDEPRSLRVRLVGTAETEATTALRGLFDSVHREAVRGEAREVTVDIRDLEFMTSSCFKVFVAWVGQIEELDLARQYRITFLSDAAKHWQERSLGALSCFATHLIHVES